MDTERVIADVDLSVAHFLGAALEPGTTVAFDTPSTEWAKAVHRPAVSCFLHRVVEDIGRRAADWIDERGDDGRVGARQPPVRHYQLHYQVSAWATSVDAEHRLLGQVMEACLADETIPASHCAGVFQDETEPLLLRLAVPMADPGPQPHDVWASLGLPLRASLELALVVPLRPTLITDVAPAAEELSMLMQSVGTAARRSRRDVEVLAERRWTAFRIRETSGSDDPCLDGIGDGV